MGINVIVDEKLLEEAERLTGEHDRQKLLEQALQELIGRQAATQTPGKSMFDLVGKVRLRDDYDYKAMRTNTVDPD